MNKGKDICKELKAVRRRIAADNGIPLEMPECTHEGPCPGTCPRCEAEVRYLENALAGRIGMGKVATVAGLALALAAPVAVQAQEPVRQQAGVTRSEQFSRVTGTIIDGRTKELLPFCNVTFVGTDKKRSFTKFATTDFDGRFAIDLPDGEYTMRVAYVGYKSVEKTITVSGATRLDDLMLEPTAVVLGGCIGPDAPMQDMEIEGVKVYVK